MKRTNKKSGMTMIELLVGLALSGIIFIASSSLMVSLFSSNVRLKQQETLEQSKSDLIIELSDSIRWARDIIIDETNNRVIITMRDGTNKTFVKNGNQFLKNGEPLTSTAITMTDFRIEEYSKSSNNQLKSVLVTLAFENEQFNAVKDRLSFIATQRIGQ